MLCQNVANRIFKVVFEEKLGRIKERKREQTRGKSGSVMCGCKAGSDEKERGRHSQLKRGPRSKERAWQETDACIMLPEASDTDWDLSKQ